MPSGGGHIITAGATTQPIKCIRNYGYKFTFNIGLKESRSSAGVRFAADVTGPTIVVRSEDISLVGPEGLEPPTKAL